MRIRHSAAKRPKFKRVSLGVGPKTAKSRLSLRRSGKISPFKSKRILSLTRGRGSNGDLPKRAVESFPETPASAANEVQVRIRELIKLAKEQGYLTFDDLNEALPEGVTAADELDAILTRLRRMEIDIIEASDVDRHR